MPSLVGSEMCIRDRGSLPCLPPDCISFLPANSYAKSQLSAGEDAEFWGGKLSDVEMLPHRKTQTQALSTGQKKRLAISKLLASQKPIWILDEPLSGLDENGRKFFASQIKTHVVSGGIALIASHMSIHIVDIPTRRMRLT